MKKPKVSTAIATFNEEDNIVDLIESLKDLSSEIVIADGSSIDRTADLAKKHGAKVIKTTNKPMFHINKNMAIKNCNEDWVLLMDADERMTPQLTAEIKEIIAGNPRENGFWVNRKNWFLGGFLTKGGAYPDAVIRLFRNGKGILPEISVHEQVKIEGKKGYLSCDLVHMADPDFKRYLQRAIRYTDLSANHLKKKDPGIGVVQVAYHMLIKPFITFINIYFRHKGYQDGFRGFVWALFSSAHHYYAYVKYWHNKVRRDKHY